MEKRGGSYPDDDPSLSASRSSGHKRTRRRRRPKTYNKGGMSVGSRTSATASTSGLASHGTGLTSHGTMTSVTQLQYATRNKQHDAPMSQKDLYFALRCGIVNVGPLVTDTAVGRVTLVNWENEIVLDTFVKVPVRVTNYRTEVTGITPGLLERGASSLDTVRKKVGSLIRGKILIGHVLEVDLGSLRLTHPWCDMRDTATYSSYMMQQEQETMDPTKPRVVLLPRALDDLVKNALEQPPPEEGQPVLVAEAIGCMALYKAAREEWEGQIVEMLQQREQQRMLMVNMRSSGPSGVGEGLGGEMIGGPVLARIAEDGSAEEPAAAVTPFTGNSLMQFDHMDRFMMYPRSEYSEYETSTLASDVEATIENYDLYRDDDASETSSFVTSDTRSRGVGETELYPLFENLDILPHYGQPPATSIASGTVGSSTTVAGSQVEEWTVRDGGSLGPSYHSGIWTPALSVATEDWSQEYHHGRAAVSATNHGDGRNEDDSNMQNPAQFAVSQTPPVSLTEEELREHLPAHLLDDLEGTSTVSDGNHPGKKQNQEDKHKEKEKKGKQRQEPKKRSWFGFGRRRRSLSVSTSGDASFAEMKAGNSRLSLSDRLPRRSKKLLSENQSQDPRRSASYEDSSDVLRPPPGF